jgi:hypothetical protein
MVKSGQLKPDLLFGLTNSVAPEPEGVSPHSQHATTGPYPEPDESTPQSPSQYFQDPF